MVDECSWGSGASPWGFERDDQFSVPNHWDGMLEVVGVTGVLHLGQIQSGLRSAIRIAQVGSIARNRIPVLDNEQGARVVCLTCKTLLKPPHRFLGRVKSPKKSLVC